MIWKNSHELYVYTYSLPGQGSKPVVLQHNEMTNSEMEIENYTTLRMRSISSDFCTNYQGTKGNTMWKLTRTCLCDLFGLLILFIVSSMFSIISTLLY